MYLMRGQFYGVAVQEIAQGRIVLEKKKREGLSVLAQHSNLVFLLLERRIQVAELAVSGALGTSVA